MNYINSNVILLSLFLGLFASTVLAQTGPEVPCVNCEQFTQRTKPSNGLWHNLDQDSQGFSFEIQNGQIGGIYYGYNEAGVAIWLVFSAVLVASAEPGVMWTVDATLNQFANSNCFNCEIKGADVTDHGQIQLKFRHKNHASVRLDNGPWQNITPIIFGTAATADFPSETDYLLPDLDGVWTFVYHENADAGSDLFLVRDQRIYSSETLVINNKHIVETAEGRKVEYSVARYSGNDIVLLAAITCKFIDVNGQLEGPTCVYAISGLPVLEFNFSLGGLGAYRIFGETVDRHTFEAIKVDSTQFKS